MKKLLLGMLILLFSQSLFAGVTCTLGQNTEPDREGAFKLVAERIEFNGIQGNQISLGSTINQSSGTFDLDMLEAYYKHEQMNCPQFEKPTCEKQEDTLIFKGGDLPNSVFKIVMTGLDAETIDKIVGQLF